MLFSYGNGEYIEGNKRVKGQVILSEHKLFLKGPEGDLAPTFIPLEKIEKIRKTFLGLEVYVRPSMAAQYVALLKGEKKYIADLAKDLISRRGLKKRFWVKEWFDESF